MDNPPTEPATPFGWKVRISDNGTKIFRNIITLEERPLDNPPTEAHQGPGGLLIMHTNGGRPMRCNAIVGQASSRVQERCDNAFRYGQRCPDHPNAEQVITYSGQIGKNTNTQTTTLSGSLTSDGRLINARLTRRAGRRRLAARRRLGLRETWQGIKYQACRCHIGQDYVQRHRDVPQGEQCEWADCDGTGICDVTKEFIKEYREGRTPFMKLRGFAEECGLDVTGANYTQLLDMLNNRFPGARRLADVTVAPSSSSMIPCTLIAIPVAVLSYFLCRRMRCQRKREL